MMKKLLWGVFSLALIALTHTLTIMALPKFIMSKATKAMAEQRGIDLHEFVLSPRLTPETQSVVRPSPDLAYSVCRFDVSKGPIILGGNTWPHYASLTIFDHQTNAIHIARLTSNISYKDNIILHLQGTPKPIVDIPVVTLPHPQGLALIRRLAPNDARYAEVLKLAVNDQCEPYHP